MSSQNRCKLVQTAQIKFPYISRGSLVSIVCILGPSEVIWTEFWTLRNGNRLRIASNGPRMYKNDTKEKQLR